MNFQRMPNHCVNKREKLRKNGFFGYQIQNLRTRWRSTRFLKNFLKYLNSRINLLCGLAAWLNRHKNETFFVLLNTLCLHIELVGQIGHQRGSKFLHVVENPSNSSQNHQRNKKYIPQGHVNVPQLMKPKLFHKLLYAKQNGPFQEIDTG